MKDPKEYLKDFTRPLDNVIELHTGDGPEILKIIRQAQIEAYNEALEDAAKNADTKSFKLSKYSKKPRWKLVKDEEVDLFSYDFKTIVNKQSILNLKK